MKFAVDRLIREAEGSPSARREWIEIAMHAAIFQVATRLPLRGGSGLKLLCHVDSSEELLSPSARREWIEISYGSGARSEGIVSLCEEGVD